jgi:hypothetical protein
MELTVDSLLSDLLDDPQVEEYFEEHLSIVTNHPNLGMAKIMPFSTVVAMTQGGISEDELTKLKEFLETL